MRAHTGCLVCQALQQRREEHHGDVVVRHDGDAAFRSGGIEAAALVEQGGHVAEQRSYRLFEREATGVGVR